MSSKNNRIVIIGGGFGGLFTTLHLNGEVETTLISNEDHFLFTPLLYEYLSGEVEAWHIAPAYSELLDEKVRLVHGKAVDVDFAKKEVIVANHGGTFFDSIGYDALVIAPGSVTNFANVPGAAENAMEFRRMVDADSLRQRMAETLDRIPFDCAPQDARRMATFAIVGAGASGVELATKMADMLHAGFEQRGLKGDPRLVILEMMNNVVPGMSDDIREYVENALLESRVEVHTQTRVLRVMPGGLTWEHLEKEETLEAAAVVWTAGVRVNPLIEKLRLEKTWRKQIVVEPTLQARGHENIFALGDVAFYPDLESPRLAGTAQLAFQQARLAGKNVSALFEGKPLRIERFEEMGEAVSLGVDRAALLAAGRVLDGALARKARFLLYSTRLPTWQHRLRVNASWFFEGTSPEPLRVH
ncbi:MAG: NAD(P)/FAD-dependent oxidoreductase [Blastocatellales bacterium]